MALLRRQENGPLQLYTLRFRSWEKRHAQAAALLRYVIALTFTFLFAYRLLLLSQWWAHRSSLSRQLIRGNGEPFFVDYGSVWLPPAWVGQPPLVNPLACSPQLLIIGAMKGGTTALFHYLNGSQPAVHYANGSKSYVDYSPRFHPGIIGAHVTKELHFFDKQPAHTTTASNQRKYFASFPGVDMAVDDPLAGKCSYPAKLGLSSSSRPGLIRMEATAMYLAHPAAAGNIKAMLPEVRMVALLREPVSRALSSVNMLFQRSPEYAHLREHTQEYNQAWQAYVVAELRRQLKVVADCFARVQPGRYVHQQMDSCVFTPTGTLAGVLHIHVGLYAVHLERWFTHFPPEQLLIWSSNAFDEKPREHMEQLVDWLGLDPALTKQDDGSFQKMHERRYPAASLPRSLFQELVAFFNPHNQRLFALLEQYGYGGLAVQLRKAWELELQETVSTLQTTQLDAAIADAAMEELPAVLP